MLKAIAIDDEPLALKVIQLFCEKTEGIVLEKTFTSQTEAQAYLHQYPVDLLFLDIQMPQKNGMEFYRSINQELPVIFTTAYTEYAVEGFNVSATDYLVKPFSLERFQEAVQKAVRKHQYLMHTETQKHLLIRADYRLHKIDFADILYIEALDDYIQIYMRDNHKLLARMPMKEIMEKLPQNEFVRTHRSYIVPLKNITSLRHKSLQVNNTSLPIGDSYKANLISLLSDGNEGFTAK